MEILELGATQLSEQIKKGHVSSEEVCRSFLERIDTQNPKLNAFLEMNPQAIEEAKKKDAQPNKQGRLFGVPIAVKDNFCVKGMKTTAASKILGNFEPPYTAFCIEKLQQEGAIILGKTNLDEFAMGSSNENSAFGVCGNPWGEDLVPGGSSGGSASAVAAGLAPLSVGSDTGGSVRQPASFCGVVGIKPSYGLVSRFGMIAFASSLDQAGTFGRSVYDAALALDCMIAKDHRDETNVKARESLNIEEKLPSLSDLKIGLPKEYMEADLQEEVRQQVSKLIDELKSAGANIVPVELPHTKYAIPVYYLVAASEASSNLSRYDGIRYGLRVQENQEGQPITNLAEFYKATRSEGFGDEVKRRILLGTFALSAGSYSEYFEKACRVRRLIAQDFTEAFEKCDLILGPVSTSTAFKKGEKISDPVSMYNNDILTTPANLAGLPSMSLPIGLDDQRRPIGLQLIAPAFEDRAMIQWARHIESIVDFKEVPPA
ncbi:MAG: Asp-tRNA(Asn)/Glu-tRNA(Gln) amidotransferase subunit GatA [Pseudomonadota bacterium]